MEKWYDDLLFNAEHEDGDGRQGQSLHALFVPYTYAIFRLRNGEVEIKTLAQRMGTLQTNYVSA